VPYGFAPWAVWVVSFPYAMRSRENARKNLKRVLFQMKERWQEWRDAQLRGVTYTAAVSRIGALKMTGLRVGVVDFVLRIGSDLFRGLAVGAVGIELDVGVEIGHSGLIVFLAQVNQRQQVIDLRLVRS